MILLPRSSTILAQILVTKEIILWMFGRDQGTVMVVAIKLAIVTYYPEPNVIHKTLEDQPSCLVNQTNIFSLNNAPYFPSSVNWNDFRWLTNP